jgi:hypothetical protein
MLASILKSDAIARHLFQESKAPPIEMDSFIIYKKMTNMSLEMMILKRNGKRVQKGSFCRSVEQARTRLYRNIFLLLFHLYLGTIDVEAFEKIVRLTLQAKSGYQRMTSEQHREFCYTLTNAVAALLS